MAALREREEGNRRFRQEGSGSCIHSLQPRRDEREQAAQMQGAGRRRDRDEDQMVRKDYENKHGVTLSDVNGISPRRKHKQPSKGFIY